MASLLWFRHDLRLADNPALLAASRVTGPIIPVYIWSPEEEGAWPPGAASRWWLHNSLASLDESLRKHGSRLTFRRGRSLETLRSLANETGAHAVFWNRRYEPYIVHRDEQIQKALASDGFAVQSSNGSLLFEPWQARNLSGNPFRVFTAFWKACRKLPPPPLPEEIPSHLAGPDSWPDSLSLNKLQLLPPVDWAEGLRESWRPGEHGAAAELSHFLEEALATYHNDRDLPARKGTSRLSPHLRFGEISVRQVWHAVCSRAVNRTAPKAAEGSDAYLRELGWREFAYHSLYHFSHISEQPLRPEFREFPWRSDKTQCKAWRRGKTGYPIVDAGMRELWRTGWMHNRVRMIVASFLVKDLRLHWLEGARWFWDTLVDADLANNTLGWQWTAGCGADAAPYFRVFNPVKQGEKFDPEGVYVRRWIPELAGLPHRWIHKPWMAPPAVLAAAGIELGRTYPHPAVDHAAAREEALAAYRGMRA